MEEMTQMEENRMEYENQPRLFPVDRREWIYGLVCLICAFCLSNFVLQGGFYLGFALASLALTLSTCAYLLSRGHKLTAYSGALLVLSLVICAGFIRSNDSFVKFVLLCFLAVAENLSLCLLAGQNLRSPGGFSTVFDAPRALFTLGLGQIEPAVRSMFRSAKNSGKAGRLGGGFVLGLLLALPLLAVVVVLLIRADAAFSGLVNLLPKADGGEIYGTAICGILGFFLVFPRAVGLSHREKQQPQAKQRKGLYPVTVNTVLLALCLVYLVYLFSQLAYFTGGLSGILPQEYTMAQYARQGFFEMAWLCAINLFTVAIAVAVVKKEEKAPLFTRLLCLFISLITLFFVVAASAKMGLYIGSYGLTRLRVLTEVIMVFMAITTVLVAIWLFVPKMPYMKAVLLTALVMGALVLWVDVDTVVAAYNVTAYEKGLLLSLDVPYLATLSDGAIAYIARAAEIMPGAGNVLHIIEPNRWNDLRDWNIASWLAERILSSLG